MSASASPSTDRRILEEVLSIPTAPFAEHKAIDYVERFCAGRTHLSLEHDSAGNILVRVRRGKRRVARPPCITAHLDHPGFVADRMISRRRLRAHWRGGVPPEYFVGAGVRFFVDREWIKGHVRSVKTSVHRRRKRVDTAAIDLPGEVPPGSVGMWDFPDPIVRGTRIYARGCDDLAGVAAILCCIDTLLRAGNACDVYFLFTRAEEVGFIGAIAAARASTIPKKCYVVVMETSSELPHARMGDGPILRVGDRATTFTSPATAHCGEVADDLARGDKSFKYQRKLMDGGMCEASAFCTLGYEVTGLCLALGNYHNVDVKRKRLGPEYIDLNDFDNCVKWFVALARTSRLYTGRDASLRARINKLSRTYNPLLRSSRKQKNGRGKPGK